MKKYLRLFVRIRCYADIGTWYLPQLDTIIPIVFGVVQQSITFAVSSWLLLKIFSALIGYADYKYFKRVQYQNDFTTRMNPFMIEIKKGVRKHG